MKKCILIGCFLFYITGTQAQPGLESIPFKIQRVENSLAPTIVYGDTIPHLNLEQRMKELGVKGVSIAVIKNYKIEWAKGYGWANEAAGKKVTTATRFQAASISKSINSLGVLLLAQQGKLDPEADINTYLRKWKFPYDSVSNGKKINTYQLLSHTAGLGIHGFPGYKKTDTLPTPAQILDGVKPANTKAVRSLFEPGKQFQYSGGGTTISQLLVEDITGKDYAAYMQQAILKPLGMTNSSYEQVPSDKAERAIGYYDNGVPVEGGYHIYPEQAAAGLWTTPTDLAKYIIECQLALKGRSKKVLSQAMMQKRMTPYMDTVFALGVFIDKRGERSYFNHNGGNEAFLCTSYGSLDKGDGVVIMINGERFGILTELLNSVAQVYGWEGFYKPEFRKQVRISMDSIASYGGDYLLGSDTLTVLLRDNELCLQENRQSDKIYQTIFVDKEHFFIKEVPGAAFRVLRDTTGQVDALELKQGDAVLRLPKRKTTD